MISPKTNPALNSRVPFASAFQELGLEVFATTTWPGFWFRNMEEFAKMYSSLESFPSSRSYLFPLINLFPLFKKEKNLDSEPLIITPVAPIMLNSSKSFKMNI